MGNQMHSMWFTACINEYFTVLQLLLTFPRKLHYFWTDFILREQFPNLKMIEIIRIFSKFLGIKLESKDFFPLQKSSSDGFSSRDRMSITRYRWHTTQCEQRASLKTSDRSEQRPEDEPFSLKSWYSINRFTLLLKCA